MRNTLPGPAPIPLEGGGRRSAWTPIIYILLVIFGVTTVFPFLWVVGAAFKPTDEITSKPLQLFPESRPVALLLLVPQGRHPRLAGLLPGAGHAGE